MLCVVIAAATMLGACGAPQDGPPRTSDEMAVVADIDGQHVYMYELTEWLKMMGLEANILQDSEYKKDILDYFIDQKVTEVEIRSKGFYDNLTEEDIELAENYADYDIQSGMQNSAMTEEQVLESIGMNKEELIERYKVNIAGGAAFDEMVGKTEPTEEELKAKYESTVAAQKEQMDADPAQYVASVGEGATTYYTPAGVRMVRTILIPFDEDTAGAIGTLREAGFNDQANLVRQDGLSKIQIKAEDALAKLTSGTTFSDVLAEYNKDEELSVEGYPVAAGTDVYSEEFTQAAMALAGIGKFSQLVATDDGYHIIEYTSDLKQGAADFESVKETIIAELKPDKQSEAWEAIVAQWKLDHKVVSYYDNLPSPEPSVDPSAQLTEDVATP
jgi:parvulin-like peptidyl-prolyl isomerase